MVGAGLAGETLELAERAGDLAPDEVAAGELVEKLLELVLGLDLLVVELDTGLLEGLDRVAEAREVDVEGCRRGELLHPVSSSQ